MKKINEKEVDLSKETIQALEKSRKRIKQGYFLTEEEVKKRLGLE